MCSAWLGLAFTRFRYLTDLQENNKRNSCFVTISNNIQVNSCPLDDPYNLIASTNKLLSSLIKMTKWHAHVVHMAKRMNMVRGESEGPWARAPLAPHKSGADYDNVI